MTIRLAEDPAKHQSKAEIVFLRLHCKCSTVFNSHSFDITDNGKGYTSGKTAIYARFPSRFFIPLVLREKFFLDLFRSITVFACRCQSIAVPMFLLRALRCAKHEWKGLRRFDFNFRSRAPL